MNLKGKVLAIVLMLVAFATNANAQSVVYSFKFSHYNWQLSSTGYGQVLIYDNRTVVYKGTFNYRGEKYSINRSFSINYVYEETGEYGYLFLSSSTSTTNVKNNPFIRIANGTTVFYEKEESRPFAMYIDEKEQYYADNEKNRNKMLDDYRNRRGIWSVFGGGSSNTTTTTTKPSTTTASAATKEAYNKGLAYFKAHNDGAAYPWLKKAADAGYCPAYEMLAEIYDSYGSQYYDISKAHYYYSLAADCVSKNTRDYWFSCWRLATFYEKGLGGVSKNLNKALYYYQQARAYTISSNYPLFDSEIARVKQNLR